MDFRQYILDTLLDKYEKSTHYQGKSRVKRRIVLNVNNNTFPWYWESERPHLKYAIHQVVAELAAENIVYYSWLPFERDNLLESIWLNIEEIESAYAIAKRWPKKTRTLEVAAELEGVLPGVNRDWIKNYLLECIKELREQNEFPPLLPEDKEDRVLLINTLMGLENKGDNILLERVFSLKYLGHSKLFQREVRGALTKIAARYLEHSDLNEDEIILELGLEKTSEEVLVWGPISFYYDGKEIDYSQLPFGGVIDTKYIDRMQLSTAKVPRIITIENKANFHYLVDRSSDNRDLVVYLGGFPGPRKREFLRSLYGANPTSEFYHWGDIDLGGFRIFQTIRGVVPCIKPLFMDEETLSKYRDYCEQLEDGYIKQLEKLLANQEYEVFWPVIKLMLKERIRLEQEALLL